MGIYRWIRNKHESCGVRCLQITQQLNFTANETEVTSSKDVKDTEKGDVDREDNVKVENTNIGREPQVVESAQQDFENLKTKEIYDLASET